MKDHNLKKHMTCDCSRGDVQCTARYYRPADDEGYLCCAYQLGHEGDHHTCYETYEDGRNWVIVNEVE